MNHRNGGENNNVAADRVDQADVSATKKNSLYVRIHVFGVNHRNSLDVLLVLLWKRIF